MIVEDLTGRGRIILPADYLAQHCEYGWASTIDSAQGATADIGLALVRPGMDREHLYVAMTRGRLANHAYITPDTPTNDDHHIPDHTASRTSDHVSAHAPVGRAPDHDGSGQHPNRSQPELDQPTQQVLETALTTSGSQDAAHTALTAARKAAIATARRDAARHASQQTAQREAQADAARKPTLEHTADLEQLRQLQEQRAELRNQHQVLIRQRQNTETQLSAAPRWAKTRVSGHEIPQLAG